MSGYDDAGRGRSGGRGTHRGDRGYRSRDGHGDGYGYGAEGRGRRGAERREDGRDRAGGHGRGGAPRDRAGRRGYDDEPREGTINSLVGHLHALDNRSYAAYKAIVGHYDSPEGWTLHVDRVQPDPYAPPTAIRIMLPVGLPGLDVLTEGSLLATSDRRVAVTDFLARELHEGFRGSALSIAPTGQEILERSSVVVLVDGEPLTQAHGAPPEGAEVVVEVRARLALPAQGRSILGREAARVVGRDLPRCLDKATDLTGERAERLRAHVAVLEDHRALTALLAERGWVSFLADGSVLPRRSGITDVPLPDGVPLSAPEELAATVELPHLGTVRGTVVGTGVTLIVGGGYHGKSTLLSAIERGVYPHVPGDGREVVATVPDAVKVRAADGRAVTGVDLSPFISHLPGGRSTTSFSTGNASGSTSQAASIMEAVEAGATALLLDEDTSATNLLIRDARMRALVADEREPITPLVDRIGALASHRAVSTVLVMGGSGDYLDVADRVLLMDAYHLRDATAAARRVVAERPREVTEVDGFPTPSQRVPLPAPERTRRGPVRTRSRGTEALVIDRDEVDVRDVAGVVDPGQAEAMARALRALLEERFDGESSLARCLEDLGGLLAEEGLDALGGRHERPAFLVRPRLVDVAAAVNRYRRLTLTTES